MGAEGGMKGVGGNAIAEAIGPRPRLSFGLGCRCGRRTDGEAPPSPAALLVPISQGADGAAETLSAADVAADASNYLTIQSPPLQKKTYQTSKQSQGSFNYH